MLDIEVSSQHVIVANQHVFRTVDISQGAWKKFWNVAKDLDEKGILTIETKLQEALEENKILSDLVNEMRDKLRSLGEA